MRFAKANWKGSPNENPGAMGKAIGLVLHIEQGSEVGTVNWFHNPAAQASAHFGNPKIGPLDQFVDTADMAWAEVNGNPVWYSVEHEGFSGQPLTANQIENDAQLLAWLHREYDIPLVTTDNPNVGGLGWHGMGGLSWGGHFDCPGDPIKGQRAQIIARAKEILSPPEPLAKGTPTPAQQKACNLTRLVSNHQIARAKKNGYTLWYWSETRFVAQIGTPLAPRELYANVNWRRKK